MKRATGDDLGKRVIVFNKAVGNIVQILDKGDVVDVIFDDEYLRNTYRFYASQCQLVVRRETLTKYWAEDGKIIVL